MLISFFTHFKNLLTSFIECYPYSTNEQIDTVKGGSEFFRFTKQEEDVLILLPILGLPIFNVHFNGF